MSLTINGTSVRCKIDTCFSNTAYLYATNGSSVLFNELFPNPPAQPLVSKLNTTALNVSWSSPWSYPVNNYTLTISSPAFICDAPECVKSNLFNILFLKISCTTTVITAITNKLLLLLAPVVNWQIVSRVQDIV